MLTLNDWLGRKILNTVIKKAFKKKFGYDIKLDLRNVQIEADEDSEEVTLTVVGSAKMKAADLDKLIDEI